MKFNLTVKILITLTIFSFIMSQPNPNSETGGKAPKNEYLDDREVKHSLFREKDSLERLSVEPTGIPKPKNTVYFI